MEWQGWAKLDNEVIHTIYWTVLEMESEKVERHVAKMVAAGDDEHVVSVVAGHAEYLRKRVENLKRKQASRLI